MKNNVIPRSQITGAILKGQLAKVVYKNFASYFQNDSKNSGLIQFKKSDFKDLYEIFSANVSSSQIKKVRCLAALKHGKSMPEIAQDFKVTELFLISLMSRFRKEGLKAAIFKKSRPVTNLLNGNSYADAIRIVSNQPLPEGYKVWSRLSLGQAVKVHLNLNQSPGPRVIARILKELNFVKCCGRYVPRNEKR